MSQLRTLLLIGSAVALAACSGAEDVASPGDGVIVFPPVTTPTPNPQPEPQPQPGGALPQACPTGTANVGTILAGGAGGRELRNCQLSGVITGNLVLPNIENLVYSISGGVRIGKDMGAGGNAVGGERGILTIEPGVVLFGASGSDFLLIERGSQIFAEGTADKPIIMTSRSNMEGTAGDDTISQWGGLVILGRAPVSNCIAQGAVGGTVDCQAKVEGAEGFYGGNKADDNSGRLRYLQIRFPGYEVTAGNELNGITFAGVGSGTFANNLQVHNSSDDGIEWFGGRVNHKYVVITGADDDSLDTDYGYRGKLQFGLVVQRTAGGDRLIEGDTSGNDLLSPRSFPTFANVTYVGKRSPSPLLFRGGTDYNIWNSVISTTANYCVQINDAYTMSTNAGTDKAGAPDVRSTYMACANADAGHGTAGEVASLLKAAARNNRFGSSTLISTWFPGANEAATPVYATSDSFFTSVNYVGAFSGSTDKWYAGWACGLGEGTASCNVAPLPIQ